MDYRSKEQASQLMGENNNSEVRAAGVESAGDASVPPPQLMRQHSGPSSLSRAELERGSQNPNLCTFLGIKNITHEVIYKPPENLPFNYFHKVFEIRVTHLVTRRRIKAQQQRHIGQSNYTCGEEDCLFFWAMTFNENLSEPLAHKKVCKDFCKEHSCCPTGPGWHGSDGKFHHSICAGNMMYAIVVKAAMDYGYADDFLSDHAKTPWKKIVDEIRSKLGLNFDPDAISKAVSSSKNTRKRKKTKTDNDTSLFVRLLRAKEMICSNRSVSFFDIWLQLENFYEQHQTNPVSNTSMRYSLIEELVPLQEATVAESSSDPDEISKPALLPVEEAKNLLFGSGQRADPDRIVSLLPGDTIQHRDDHNLAIWERAVVVATDPTVSLDKMVSIVGCRGGIVNLPACRIVRVIYQNPALSNWTVVDGLHHIRWNDPERQTDENLFCADTTTRTGWRLENLEYYLEHTLAIVRATLDSRDLERVKLIGKNTETGLDKVMSDARHKIMNYQPSDDESSWPNPAHVLVGGEKSGNSVQHTLSEVQAPALELHLPQISGVSGQPPASSQQQQFGL